MSTLPPHPPSGEDPPPSPWSGEGGGADPTPAGPPPGYGPGPSWGYGPPSGFGPGGYGPSGGFAPYQPAGPWSVAPDHPQATTVLVLGICSIVFTFICGIGIFLGPVAWVMGGRALQEIDAEPGRYGGRSNVQVGRICGIIATVFLLLAVVVVATVIAAGLSSS